MAKAKGRKGSVARLAEAEGLGAQAAHAQGEVVKLDRGFPLVRLADGALVRCEHGAALVKGASERAVIGDVVALVLPDGHDKGIIESIAPRRCELVRKDPTERAVPQVLAANFDRVMVVQAVSEVNLRRLERELVLAAETRCRRWWARRAAPSWCLPTMPPPSSRCASCWRRGPPPSCSVAAAWGSQRW